MSPESTDAVSQDKDATPPLRSVHSTSFPALLDELGISLLVTTYQAGKLAILRSDEGKLNTHFRNFPAPMGLALDGNRLAIGTKWQLWEYHNVPAVADKIKPEGRHDACFLPRSCHATGNVFIHEMAWARDDLWFVNTRFSCLCTLDRAHSFVPRWRPSFISALAPEDRCHLNGMGMRDGRPRYATALGDADTAGGWRANKAHGGVLLDVQGDETIVRGLSMPHSPRWHRNRLWVCESGAGTIGTVDVDSGRYEAVAEVPGFSRGVDFHGRFAFIGLSQVRESAVFSGIPITERLAQSERCCGVWVVDLVTGRTVAFVKFEDAVQEIFAVTVVPNSRYPDLINDDEKQLQDSFVLPDDALKLVPEMSRASTPSGAKKAPAFA